MYPGGGAPAWSPLDFGADLLFWFDANVMCSGALWVDQGPNGYDLSQATGSKQPTLITADPDFDGNNSLSFNNAALQTMSTAASFAYGLFELWIFCATDSAQRLYTHNTYEKSVYMSGPYQGYANNLGEGKLDLVGASTLVDPLGLPRMIGHRWDGSSATHDVLQAGTIVTDSRPVAGGPSPATGSGQFWLGSYLDTGEYLHGRISEIIGIKNRVATAPETVSLNGYRAAKYPGMP